MAFFRYSDVLIWARRRELLVFFLAVFLFMWPRGLVDAAVSMGWIPAPSAILTVSLGVLYLAGIPIVVALVVTAMVRGQIGVKELFSRVFRWQVNWRWYFVVLLVYPLASVVALTLSDIVANRAWSVLQLWQVGFVNLRENAARVGLRTSGYFEISVILLISSVIVSISEEVGWRAFAVPQLLKKNDSLSVSLIVGCIWAIWHLPNFFIKGTDHYGMPFFWFFLTLLAVSTLMVWVMNHTGQSVLLMVLFHVSIILSGHFFPTQLVFQTGNYLAFWLTCGFLVAVALSVVLVEGRELGKR